MKYNSWQTYKSDYQAGLKFFFSSRLLDEGTFVQKHVEFDTFHELYFIIYIIFYWLHSLVDVGNADG
jgi:hypothetical protein